MRKLSHLSEDELVAMINVDDHAAFLEIYHRHKAVLIHNLIRILKSHELAEEVLQDIFLMLWEKRKEMDPAQSVAGYLYRAAVNRTKNIFRQLAVDQRMREDFLRTLESTKVRDAQELLESREVKSTLQDLLERLPIQQRKVYMLCKLDGMSYREVSEMLHISETTVNSHIRNANKFLRTEINKKTNLSSVLYLALLFFLIS